MSAKTRIHEYRRIIVAGVLVVLIALSVISVNNALGGSLNPDDSDVFVVVTGSMDAGETDWPISTIPVNSLVVVKTLDGDEVANVNVGDVVAFKMGSVTVVHRVVAVNIEDRTLKTHGDANIPDQIETVSFDSVTGTVINVYPTLGKIVTFAKDNTVLLLLGICAIIMGVYATYEIIRIVNKKEEK